MKIGITCPLNRYAVHRSRPDPCSPRIVPLECSALRCAPPTRARGRTRLPPPFRTDACKMQICHKALGPWKLCVRLVQDVPKPETRLALTDLLVSQQQSHVAISTTPPSTVAASRLQHVCWSGIHGSLQTSSHRIDKLHNIA